MYQLTQCPTCPRKYYIDVAQIARGLIRFACPECDALATFADEQQTDPNLSPGTRDVWTAISAVALVAGLFVFAHYADQVIDQLTA